MLGRRGPGKFQGSEGNKPLKIWNGRLALYCVYLAGLNCFPAFTSCLGLVVRDFLRVIWKMLLNLNGSQWVSLQLFLPESWIVPNSCKSMPLAPRHWISPASPSPCHQNKTQELVSVSVPPCLCGFWLATGTLQLSSGTSLHLLCVSDSITRRQSVVTAAALEDA